MTIDPAALRLAAVVESSDDAIISHTLEGTIDTWNPAAERMFGYAASEAVGRHIDLILPPGRFYEQNVMAQVLAGERVRHFEIVAVARDGSQIPISLTISRIRAPGGEVFGLSWIARDVSDFRALEREAFRLAALVSSAEDAIVSKDLNGIVLTWNKAAERMFGYSAAEIVGKSITMIIPMERRGEEDKVLARIRAGLSIEHFETVRQRKDGSLIEISLSVSPIKTGTGAIIGASKIARDVSRQKALEREALRLAAIVDSSEDAIVSSDLNGVVQTWNKAAERMFGFTSAEMLGASILRIVPPELQQEEEDTLARVREGSGIEHFETVRQRKDGSVVEVSLSASPIRTPEGTIIGASRIARDITIQRQLARAAEEANRVKDEFLATLSHELRTPLNAVLGYTRMLRTGHVAEGRKEHAIDVIERNATMLSQLVADVLDVSSIVTGKVRLKQAWCELGSVLAAAVEVVRPSADAKGVVLRAEAAAPVHMLCDPDRLQQVFWNLLTNAVKFTPRGGTIDVRLASCDGAAEVSVVDTGMGIRAESLPYVFQRFWQGESDHRQGGGLGLGLALARHFVELHGGTIAATSAGQGRGATFTVRLPIRGPDCPLERTASTESPSR